jgi:hypothetical protein
MFALAVPARAQIPGAIGQPLTSPDLPAGTVSVRVIAGAVTSPVVGTDVTLLVNGAPRVARTDSAGRATFKDLPAGAKVQAKVTDEDKKDVTSSEFPLPNDSGVRVMLSTKPFQGGAGGAPFAGGGGMPEPRQMSGEPRPEQADAPGTYTVRLTYDDFKDAPPVGVLVALVGYHADDSVELREARTDQDGRAQFGGLDRTGATSYFAMAQLPRGEGVDRMISLPSVLDSRNGVRLVLSADKRTATGPAIDDIVRIEKQEHAPAAGKVRVALQGVPDGSSEVTFVAMHRPAGVKIDDSAKPAQRRVVAHVLPTRTVPDPSDILAQSQFQPKPDVPAHTVQIQVHGGAGVNEPIVGATIRLVPAKPVGPVPDGGAVKTPTDGYVELTNPLDGPLIAEININGKEMKSQPFDLSTSNSVCSTPCGGYLDVEAQWEAVGKLEANFDSADVKPDEVVFAETTMHNIMYRSIPFQPVPGRGTSVTLYIYPRIMFSFSLTSHIDDAFLAVSGRFDVSNNSWAPYIASSDGLVIPLPKHFKGAQVAEQDQGDVAVAQGDGFRIGRPIPPGGKQFHAAFSLPVDEGQVDWSLDLPLGAFQSGLEILQTPGMSVQLPPSVKGQTMTVPQGTFFVLPQISILPKQSMNMTIIGLPSPPEWRTWAPRIVGILAVLIMLGGLGYALHRTSTTRAADLARAQARSKLLDELVELEKSGKNDKRRAQITTELEALWDD